MSSRDCTTWLNDGPEQISLSLRPKISLYGTMISWLSAALRTVHSRWINTTLLDGVWVSRG